MIYPLNANKPKRPFGWHHMLIFVVLLLACVILLYPKKLFISNIMNNTQPSEVSIVYLKNMIAKDPTNLDLKMNLAQQKFMLGYFDEARNIISPFISFTPTTDFQWKILLLYYQITRNEAFALKEDSPQRHVKMGILNEILLALVKSPRLKLDELESLGNDALAFNHPELANSFYKKIKDQHVERSIDFYNKAASAALFVKDYENSADYYIFAMQKSARKEEKRLYFMKAVDSLNASRSAEKALKLAQKNIGSLAHDRETLIYLSAIALQAGKQNIAEQYVNQVIKIEYKDLPK